MLISLISTSLWTVLRPTHRIPLAPSPTLQHYTIPGTGVHHLQSERLHSPGVASRANVHAQRTDIVADILDMCCTAWSLMG